jgi:hypothetical protein
MHFFLNGLLLIILFSIIIQDFLFKKIDIISLFLFVSCGILIEFNSVSKDIFLNNFILNFSFLIINLFILHLFYAIKEKKMVMVINSALGMGDLLFWFGLIFYFSFFNFILFYIFSLVFALILYSIYRWQKIPLAGLQAFIFGFIYYINEYHFGLDFYDDFVLFKLFDLTYA